MTTTTAADFVTARTGIGVGVGAVLGLAFAGGPIGLGLGALVGGAIAHTTAKPVFTFGREKNAPMSPKIQLVYVRAMESVKSPEDLRTLADAFDAEGHTGEAEMLRRRADGRELPDEEQEKRKLVFRKAMASDKPDAIEAVALAFARAGAIGAARTVREHAAAVRAAHAAGNTTTPYDPRVSNAFAEKLQHAIGHFGPASPQAMSSARNLLRAMHRPYDGASVQRMLEHAVRVLAPAEATPSTARASTDAEAAVDTAVEPPVTGAVEPTVVGPAAATIEPPAAPATAVVAEPSDRNVEAPAPMAPVEEDDEEPEEEVDHRAQEQARMRVQP